MYWRWTFWHKEGKCVGGFVIWGDWDGSFGLGKITNSETTDNIYVIIAQKMSFKIKRANWLWNLPIDLMQNAEIVVKTRT